MVLEEDYLDLKSFLGLPIHGIIGFDLFDRFVVELNYDDMIMTLHEPRSFKRPKRMRKVPLEIIDTKPYIKIDIQQRNGKVLKNAKMLVDTGASHAIMINRETTDDVFMPDRQLETSLGRGLGGEIGGVVGRVDKVSFSRFTFREVLTSYPDPNDFSSIIKDTGRFGTVGADIFSKLRIIIDYDKKQLFLAKGGRYRERFEFNMSGIEFKAQELLGKKIVINSIREGTPGDDAGLQKGDILYALNGSLASSMTLTQVNDLMSSKDGRTIRMVVLRNGEKLRVKFDLKRLI